MRIAASACALALSLAACASTPGTDNRMLIFDSRLQADYADYAGSMSAPRSPMTTTAGATVASCNDYLAVGGRIDLDFPSGNRLASLEYVVCDLLAALQDAAPVADLTSTDDIGQTLATRLDLRSFRSSMHQRTTDEAFTLSDLADHPLTVGKHVVELDSPDWYFKVEAVAVADIDASGRPDWLVRVVDQSLGGTYLTMQPLVIRDPGQNGLLTALLLPR